MYKHECRCSWRAQASNPLEQLRVVGSWLPQVQGLGPLQKLWAIPTAWPPLQPWGFVPEDLKWIHYVQVSFTVKGLSRCMSIHKNWDFFNMIQNALRITKSALIFTPKSAVIWEMSVLSTPMCELGFVLFSSSSLPLPNPLIQKLETVVCEMHYLPENNQ